MSDRENGVRRGIPRGAIVPPDEANLARAVDALKSGDLIGLPTETVYGLAADASNPQAVEKIFAAKGRPADHPVIVHIAGREELSKWAREIPPEAVQLAEAFWPGPLTLILLKSPHASDIVTGGLDTVGLRSPSHPVAAAVLQRFSGGLAAPSANRFGRVSPTRPEHVAEELGESTAMILDGGPCTVGLESTIVDLSGDLPRILRPGGISAEQIAAVVGRVGEANAESPRCPGRLESHYAPAASVILASPDDAPARLQQLVSSGAKPAVIFPDSPENRARFASYPASVLFPLPADPAGFAREMYAAMRQADACSSAIVIIPPIAEGFGIAIWDRLRRAAKG